MKTSKNSSALTRGADLRTILLWCVLSLFVWHSCSNERSRADNGGGTATGLISATIVGSGFTNPLYLCSPPGDTERLFVVEKAGRIKIIKNGQTLSRPFLNISDRVNSAASERGLLGMAFHPDYNANGYFYVNYTNSGGHTTISRFTVTSDVDSSDAASEAIILTVEQPFANHNAGMLAFSPKDGYLYIGLGDGGSGGDPRNNAQNPLQMLGKMLRIDVDASLPYAVPDDNPFKNSTDTLPEIWAFGLRNPWRYCFDQNGDLYIADVGQNQIEEVDFQPASSTGGENYGWRLKEGTSCYNPSTNCESGAPPLVDPVWEYTHDGQPFRCSITGGYVYRGNALPDLAGAYFVGDYCSGQIWSFRIVNGQITGLTEWTSDLGSAGTPLSSFGIDAIGELYFTDLNGGDIYKIVPAE